MGQCVGVTVSGDTTFRNRVRPAADDASVHVVVEPVTDADAVATKVAWVGGLKEPGSDSNREGVTVVVDH